MDDLNCLIDGIIDEIGFSYLEYSGASKAVLCLRGFREVIRCYYPRWMSQGGQIYGYGYVGIAIPRHALEFTTDENSLMGADILFRDVLNYPEMIDYKIRSVSNTHELKGFLSRIRDILLTLPDTFSKIECEIRKEDSWIKRYVDREIFDIDRSFKSRLSEILNH